MISGRKTVADRVLQFNKELADTALDLPAGFAVVNPFSGPRRGQVGEITTAFYRRFYDDSKPRRLVLGSSPARRGTALTGVPFADADLLEREAGIDIDGYAISRTSAGFLGDVIGRYGGHDKFYGDFVMSFVCPLGVVRTKENGTEVNANYYETKKLLNSLRVFIVGAMRRQAAIGGDVSTCYCIGSGDNFKILSAINEEERLFERIVPLAHPRYITQYNPGRRDEFLEEYMAALGTRD